MCRAERFVCSQQLGMVCDVSENLAEIRQSKRKKQQRTEEQGLEVGVIVIAKKKNRFLKNEIWNWQQ